jgi:hypothetical protein
MDLSVTFSRLHYPSPHNPVFRFRRLRTYIYIYSFFSPPVYVRTPETTTLGYGRSYVCARRVVFVCAPRFSKRFSVKISSAELRVTVCASISFSHPHPHQRIRAVYKNLLDTIHRTSICAGMKKKIYIYTCPPVQRILHALAHSPRRCFRGRNKMFTEIVSMPIPSSQLRSNSFSPAPGGQCFN